MVGETDTTGGELELLLLGPIEVRAGGTPVALGGAKPTALLADLVLHLGRSSRSTG